MLHRCFREFQLTRSRGAWPVTIELDLNAYTISTHTLTWSVTILSGGNTFVFVISTHTLTWSVTVAKYENGAILQISTHTLTWSVTTRLIADEYGYEISTHTLTWSVTRERQLYRKTFRFQLTRSRGAWRLFSSAIQPPAFISTHTLTWSVTSIQHMHSIAMLLFQLTRSRGAWPYRYDYIIAYFNFNSHAHVERDTHSLHP